MYVMVPDMWKECSVYEKTFFLLMSDDKLFKPMRYRYVDVSSRPRKKEMLRRGKMKDKSRSL